MQLAKLEVELEEATKSLKKQLADALARCADLEQKFQVQGAALEAAHKGRDTAEDAQRQTHVSLRCTLSFSLISHFVCLSSVSLTLMLSLCLVLSLSLSD